MFSALTYFFDHSIYFARLHHVNPLCKHQYAFLQMKEAPNQKVQEKKPLLKFKNTKKNMCLERIWKKCFRHRPLIYIDKFRLGGSIEGLFLSCKVFQWRARLWELEMLIETFHTSFAAKAELNGSGELIRSPKMLYLSFSNLAGRP